MNKKAVLWELENRHLHGYTEKLEIGGQDVYVKVAFYDGTLAHVDVTLSAMSGSEEFMPTHGQTRSEVTKTDNARAMIELLCRQANELLQTETWTWEDLADLWVGTDFEPFGLCKFPAVLVGDDKEPWYENVKSPLDAVAKLMRKQMSTWLARLPKEEKDDGEQHQEEEGADEGEREGLQQELAVDPVREVGAE